MFKSNILTVILSALMLASCNAIMDDGSCPDGGSALRTVTFTLAMDDARKHTRAAWGEGYTAEDAIGYENRIAYDSLRVIFYKASDRTAIAEFHQQVEDITGVLAKFGWEFGQIADNGKIENLHRAMNSIKLGMIAMQAKGYEDKETDMVHFDHSHGTPEAEVYGASEEANATVEFLAHPLERISAIETHLDLIDTTMGKMSSTMGKMSSTMIKVLEVLAQQSEILVKLSETQSNGAYAPTKADDGIAYGRADL